MRLRRPLRAVPLRPGRLLLWSGFLFPSGSIFDRLIRFSVHNKLIVCLLTLALIVWGGYFLIHLPIDAVPDITTN